MERVVVISPEYSNNGPHVNISDDSPPKHSQPCTEVIPPRNCCKRPFFEVSTSCEVQPKHKDAFIGKSDLHSNQSIHHPEPYVDHNLHQSNASFSYGHSPSASTNQGPKYQLTEQGTWAEIPSSYTVQTSYLNHHEPHQNHSFHAVPNQHQSSHWCKSSPSSFVPGTAMTCHDQSHYAAPSVSHYPHTNHCHGQIQPQDYFKRGIIASQGATLSPQTGHNISQPSQFTCALAMGEDKKWLSEFLCFVREHCAEVVCASEGDVLSRMNSKKVGLGQVGIRCRFCAHLPHKKRGGRSSTFPSSLRRIYQSITMIIRDHFESCPAMPSELKTKFKELRGNISKGADGSKQYWIHSAKSLGLVDTDSGIFFMDRRYFASQRT
mmetsp:Transcript_3492/g.4312  ORF Transcript_3492/g.4312 Transcript_3492/m.4312 type:complete len:378 (+) Transcript_3492:97-1230(+)